MYMNRWLVVSLATLAACGVDAPDESGSTAAQALTDNAIASQSWRGDGAYNVTCTDGSEEIDSAEQIAAGLACVPARTAVAHFTTMQEHYSSSLYSATGYPDRWADVRIKRIGDDVSAVFYDTWSTTFTRPLTADLVTLAADGSFTATGHTLTETSGCYPTLVSRLETWLTLIGQIDTNGTVTISAANTREIVSAATPQRVTCFVGTWSEMSRSRFDSTEPAPPITLSP